MAKKNKATPFHPLRSTVTFRSFADLKIRGYEKKGDKMINDEGNDLGDITYRKCYGGTFDLRYEITIDHNGGRADVYTCLGVIGPGLRYVYVAYCPDDNTLTAIQRFD